MSKLDYVTHYHYRVVVPCTQHPEYTEYTNPIIISGNENTYQECIYEMDKRLNGMMPIRVNIWHDLYANVFDGIKYPERG